MIITVLDRAAGKAPVIIDGVLGYRLGLLGRQILSFLRRPVLAAARLDRLEVFTVLHRVELVPTVRFDFGGGFHASS